MNISEESRQHLAAEVLELGESLFDAALEGGNQQAIVGDEGKTYPVAEIRAASAEFFTALRLLLGIDE